MPVKKGSVAYKGKLERAKARARIKKLEASVQANSKEAQSMIAELNKKIKGTYLKNNPDAAKNIQKLYEYNTRIRQKVTEYKQAAKISNTVFENEMRLTRKKASSIYTAGEMHTFMKVTKYAWEGKNPKMRYEAMMEYYGVNNLNDIFKVVMKIEKNRQAAGDYDASNPKKDAEQKDEETIRYAQFKDLFGDSNITFITQEEFKEMYEQMVLENEI